MRKVISSLDIGSSSVKLVVGEFTRGRLHILSATKVETEIFSEEMQTQKILDSIDKVCSNTSEMLGVDIKKVVLCVGIKESHLVKTTAAIKIKSENKIITSEDVNKLLQASAEKKIPKDHVLVGIQVVNFVVDGNKTVKNPKGLKSENLGIRAILITNPKTHVSTLLDIANKAGLKVVDVIPDSLADYCCFRNKITSKGQGAIVNLGFNKTRISIFNKGMITDSKIFKMGAKNIVNEIAYSYNLSDKIAYALFKDLTLASKKMANPKEYRMIENLDNRKIRVNEYQLSEIASNQISEMLKLIKKQINLLTKKQISYIIVTGGLTEISDFDIALKDFLSFATLGKINLIGARDNSYSTVIGSLCFFEEKLNLRDKNFTIFNDEELKELNDGFSTVDGNGTLIGKVFGYFFEN